MKQIVFSILQSSLKSFSLLILLIHVSFVSAEPVNRQQARQIADDFARRHGMQLRGEPKRAPRRVASQTATSEPLYIFNATSGGGFVIVAGDDCAGDIIGYSTSGEYSEQNMPDNFRSWLMQTAEEIEAVANETHPTTEGAGSGASRAPRRVAAHAAIAPLIKTKWNQGDNENAPSFIYNTLTPTIEGAHTLTGCVATAGAQIMYYYQHPKTATQPVPGYKSNNTIGTLPDLPATTFNWAAMKTTYSSADVGTESETAVSELMLYCGYAAKMDYGIAGSGSSEVVLAQAMTKLFDYDPTTLQSVDRAAYSVAEWDALIYNELAEGRPVIYSGQSWTGGGHAFLCDGYDGNGFYHFNWGWGGYHDGYFRLHVTNPYYTENRVYSSGKIESGFVIDCSAIIGLQPNSGVTPDDDVRVAKVFGTNIDGTTITMSMGNPYDEAQGFGYGLAQLNSDGTMMTLDAYNSSFYMNYELQKGWYFSFNFNVADYSLPDGTHTLVPVSQRNADKIWRHCTPSDLGFLVTVNGTDISIQQLPIVVEPQVTATQIAFTGNKLSTVFQEVVATVSSTQTDYKQPLYLFASTLSSNMGSAVYCAPTAIEEGQTEDVKFKFYPASAGKYYIWIATDKEGTNVIGTASVDITAAPTENAVLTAQDIAVFCTATTVSATINIQNTGNVTYYQGLTAYLYKDRGDGSGYYDWQDLYETQDMTLQAGQSAEVVAHFEGLEPGTRYLVTWLYRPAFGGGLRAFDAAKKFFTTLKLGDLDGDGSITATDVQLLADMILNPETAPEEADINGDNRLTISDITALIAKIGE